MSLIELWKVFLDTSSLFKEVVEVAFFPQFHSPLQMSDMIFGFAGTARLLKNQYL